MLAVELGADGPAAILLFQVGANAYKVVAAAYEQGRYPCGHLLKFIDLLEVVVEQVITQVQRRCGLAGHLHGFAGMQRQPRSEAALEQAAQALGVVLERTVEGFKLIGQQSRFTGQVFLASGEVGVVQGTQGEQSTAGDHQRQHDGEGDTKLRGDSGTRLRHGKLLAGGPDHPDHPDRPLLSTENRALFRDAGAT
ncbi:hypothetical protein D3C79_784810 [compost metagenome]